MLDVIARQRVRAASAFTRVFDALWRGPMTSSGGRSSLLERAAKVLDAPPSRGMTVGGLAGHDGLWACGA